MKNNLIIFAICCLAFTAEANAQFRIGVEAGANISYAKSSAIGIPIKL